MEDNNIKINGLCETGPRKIERIIRIMAGTLVLLGIVLAYTVHPYWIGLPIFVGLNLFQSGFTKWCLAETILKRWVKE